MSALEFNDLVVSNSSLLKVFAFSLTKDNETAKDLMQETVYKALANREKYNAGTNVKAWMYTIMRNIFINNYRRRSRQHTIFDNNAGEYLMNHAKSSVMNAAEINLRMKEIENAIHSLPEMFKQPFKLYFEGYKYNEIAHALNEPLGTIKSRIHFARKLLKEQLSRY